MNSVPWAIGLCALATAITLADAATAGLIDIENAGFEDPILADGTISTEVPGWFVSNAAAYNPRLLSLPAGPPEGNNVATVSGNGVLSQVLDTVITGNTRYELLVEVGARSEFAAGAWVVQLLSFDDGINVLMDDAIDLFDPIQGGPFETVTLTFDVDAMSALIGTNLKIRLANTTLGDLNPVLFDDIRLTASALPAPGALAFLALAGLRRRRRQG